ncbi:polysaccharide biosynthesis/export family protein [Desulfovibrio sp. SGI.169]|uniref:polysaccharide biosynthesis/export family protein n=1 Tax=Desulfovibrio sp. SGI.169 TaxID=3420561 RepID=UPI003D0339EA
MPNSCRVILALFLVALVCGNVRAADNVQPYGASLFQGNFAKGQEGGAVSPGDRIVLRLWGGRINIDDTFTVDAQGRVNLPEVGLLPVAGLPHDKLADDLRSKLAATGHADTQVYAAALDARPVFVFVTGGVVKPGRYAGSPNDPVLSFLDKAGGIDPARGSYRVVRLMRGGGEAGRLDLYPFARRGEMPAMRLQEGDTLVVGDKGPTVTATGAVRNAARFEFLKGEATGAALLELAEPEARASHISLSGTRNGAPYATYLPLKDLRHLALEDGDRVQFMADATGGAMMIEVQGAVRGSSRFPVRKGARLKDVQNFIAVEPGRANLKAMYIKRRSVAARQKKAIADSLRRLEETALTAASSSAEESQIRAREAEMIAKFVERAKSAEPEGVVVLDNGAESGNLALEDGDIIVIPGKSDVVLVSGEVMVPQAMLWNEDKDMGDYIRGAGGYSNRADRNHVLIMRQNGSVSQNGDAIRAGDQILVLPRVESKNMQAVKDISQVLMQVAVSTGAVLGLPFLQ